MRGTAAFELRTYLPYLINRVGCAVADAFADDLAAEVLTVPAWRVLAVLLRDDRSRVGELAELTSIEFSTLSRLIDGLERRGLVARKPAADDARVVHVTLTSRGRSIATRLLPAAIDLEQRLVVGMSAAEVRELRRLLDKLYASIAREGSRPRSIPEGRAHPARKRAPMTAAAVTIPAGYSTACPRTT